MEKFDIKRHIFIGDLIKWCEKHKHDDGFFKPYYVDRNDIINFIYSGRTYKR